MTPPADVRLDPSFSADPYPFLRSLRERGPVQRVLMPDGTESWWITRYADVQACLADHKRFSSAVTEAVESASATSSQAVVRRDDRLSHTLANSDPPDHTRMRRVVARAFSGRRIDAMRPMIQAIAGRLLDEIAAHDRVDLVESYAHPLPVAVICRLLGLPDASIGRFSAARASLLLAQTQGERLAAVKATREFMETAIAAKRLQPGGDVLSGLIEAADQGDLSPDELHAMAFQLLAAGHETTVYLISAGALHMLTHPGQLDALRHDPALIPDAVEEMLRFDSPVVPGIFRRAAADADIGGVTIPEGAFVVLCLASANRDPDRFCDPDRLDVRRDHVEHLTFGHGIHYCLGARLSQAEGAIALSLLIQRFPELALAVRPEEVRWQPMNFLRGLAGLPVYPYGRLIPRQPAPAH